MSDGKPVQVADGVYCLGVGRGVMASNVFLVRSGGSWVLIDAAWPGRGQLIKVAAESVFGAAARPASMLLPSQGKSLLKGKDVTDNPGPWRRTAQTFR